MELWIHLTIIIGLAVGALIVGYWYICCGNYKFAIVLNRTIESQGLQESANEECRSIENANRADSAHTVT